MIYVPRLLTTGATAVPRVVFNADVLGWFGSNCVSVSRLSGEHKSIIASVISSMDGCDCGFDFFVGGGVEGGVDRSITP